MAMREDFGDLDKAEFLYRSGFDREGRTIVVFIGCFLPAKKVSLERLFLYFLRTMDAVVEREYVIVYVAVNQSGENRPSFAWLRRVYSLFNRKYKKVSRLVFISNHHSKKANTSRQNLKKLYVVKPTTWLKMVMGLFRPFVSKKFWVKVNYVPTVQGIFDILSPQQLHFPSAFLESVTTMKPIFGESLERALMNPNNAGQDIPLVVSQCLTFLFSKVSFPPTFLHAMPFYALCRMNESNRTFPSQTNRRSNWKESSAFLGIASRPTSSG